MSSFRLLRLRSGCDLGQFGKCHGRVDAALDLVQRRSRGPLPAVINMFIQMLETLPISGVYSDTSVTAVTLIVFAFCQYQLT